MNRVTALLLAMATLLAHSLAIHLEETGEFAPPYESVHRAYHLARIWVHEGVLEWNVGAPTEENGGLEAYPSPAWVAVSAVAERTYLPVTVFTQIAGIVAALLTVALSARFDIDRLAGVVPPLLLVTSGAFAAAGPSGTEYSALALLTTSTLVAYQLHYPILLSGSLTLLVATRPEGVFFAALVALLALADHARRRLSRRRPLTAPPWWVFLLPAAATAALCAVRDGQGGSLYGGELAAILRPGAARLSTGIAYAWDFFATTVTPLLLLVPLAALAARRLSGTGARALALALGWGGVVVLRGGGPTPFALAFVPALPLVAIAVQQGIVATLDTGRPMLERACWTLLLPSCLLATFAGKFPGNIGPLRVRGIHAAWLETSTAPANYGVSRKRGRPALGEEIRRTADLRALGRFLRENVDPELTVLTPWPGAIGYLSGLRVLDLLGRATPPFGDADRGREDPRPAIDLAAQLERGADLVLPGLVRTPTDTKTRATTGMDPDLLTLDPRTGTADRGARLAQALEKYELVALPVVGERAARMANPRPVFVLRRRSLGLAPRLEIVSDGREVSVFSHSDAGDGPDGHPQLGRLEVVLVDGSGRSWYVDPDGDVHGDSHVCARAELRLVPHPEGRAIRLFQGRIPDLPRGKPVLVRAQLYNPFVRKSHPLAPIGEAAELHLRR